MPEAVGDLLVEMDGISKDFPGVHALRDCRFELRRGQTFAAYVGLYSFGRFWFENLRIDPAHRIGPLRLNAWVSVMIFAFGIWWFWWLGRHEPRHRVCEPSTRSSVTPVVRLPPHLDLTVAAKS